MDPSQPCPVDSVHEDPVEQIGSSTRFKSSELMNPGYHGSTSSSTLTMEPSDHSPVDSIKSIRGMCRKIDPKQIDQLIRFVQHQLYKMNTSSAGSSSAEGGWSETVADGTKLAEKIIATISTEAKKLSKPDAVKAMETLTVKIMEGLGMLHSVFLGLSVATFAIESYTSVGYTKNECRELLLKNLELAKEVKEYSDQMPDERERLFKSVGTIVEGSVICCDYLANSLRFWSDTIAAAQLEKTEQQMRDLRHSRKLSLGLGWNKYYGGDKTVFLSHSGKQKELVCQLHQDLTEGENGVTCFLDKDRKSLPLGLKFPPLIFKAAETCKIAVLVLSKDFIRSKWPLLELSAFMDARNSGKNANLVILPIFFMINPQEILITKDSPEWQELNESNDTKAKWQAALEEVRSINGLHFGEHENEVDFRNKVVKEIRRLLKEISPPKILDFEPVGIEGQVREVKALLDMDGAQSALAVIVCGFGGVGKSTLAASVVQSLDWSSRSFKFCWVAIDEKAPHKTDHIIKLQMDIIYDLEGVKPDLRNPDEGRVKIKEALEKKSSLLFIDNLVDKDYVRDLLPQDLLFEEQKTKLRILVTSREEDVRAKLNMDCRIHKVRYLSKEASQHLLFKTILQGKVLEDKCFDEISMINEVARACRGVPLLLSVFGGHLRTERDKDSYQEALNVLREGNLDSYRDEDLGKKLMFVYHKIKDVEVKEAFLDICMYFHGWKWNFVADIVDSATLQDLRRRMLVSSSRSGEVIVHDILRLMAMNDAKLTRFSDYNKLSEALEDDLDGFELEDVKGISLLNDNHLRTIESTQLEAMRKSLRVLMLGDWVKLEGPPCKKRFTKLRYLHVGDITAFPFEDPSKLTKLRTLLNKSKPGMNLCRLPPDLRHIWHSIPHVECDKFSNLPLQNLSSLKSFFVTTRQSVELPEELQLPPSLECLDLSRCTNLPKDIGHLSALECLILDRSNLECLPQGFGKLKKLKRLRMDSCSKLDSLSEELGMLSSLEELSMKDCKNLRALPENMGGLLSLQTLDLSACINLQELPESFGELGFEWLPLHSLVNIKKLPNSFGNMPLLKHLSLECCNSLMSFPDSFVQLKKLETLKIIKCRNLSVLPQNFGRLRCLKHMTVEYCDLLKVLPHGFGALPFLKIFELKNCGSFVNLPIDFGELRCLEELSLMDLPLISRIPDGFGNLEKLRFFKVKTCFQLKTLSDDFENMASLERLWIKSCPQLDGAMLEKILKLQNCYIADIGGSRELIREWRLMQLQGETEHPIVVDIGYEGDDGGRAARAALLHGKYVELNYATGRLMERSSLLAGLEDDPIEMVALIMLPILLQSHQLQTLQQFVEMAMERAKSKGLQIVCARKVDLPESATLTTTVTEEDERAEEEDIRQILLCLLPKGSCAIPSSESKRLKVLTYCCGNRRPYELSFYMSNVGVDIEGCNVFENLKYMGPYEIAGDVASSSEMREAESRHYNSIQNFIISLCPEFPWQSQFQYVAREGKAREFVEALKGNGIHYLLTDNNTSKVLVDDLQQKAIGFIICDFNFLECIKLQQIYKDLQRKDSQYLWIWIPNVLIEDSGHGTYTRLIQCMPWASLPYQVNIERDGLRRIEPRLVVLDKHGHIANLNALPLLVGWGVKFYPFTQHAIFEGFSSMDSESCLELLLQGMNIVGRKPMKRKMTFLYAEHPLEWHKTKCEPEWLETKSMLTELTQIHGSFELLYVGKLFYEWDPIDNNMGVLKEQYEDARQNMGWPSLSFSDMIMFWARCHYLASQEVYELNKESNTMMETLHGLAKRLYTQSTCLLLVDNDGLITCDGEETVDMICLSSDEISEWGERAMRMVKDELMESLSRGECAPLVKTFFRDEIHNHPQHPQHHRISISSSIKHCVCDVCSYEVDGEGRSYMCFKCTWWMCGSCWVAYAKEQVEQLVADD